MCGRLSLCADTWSAKHAQYCRCDMILGSIRSETKRPGSFCPVENLKMSNKLVRKSDQVAQLNRDIDNIFALCKNDASETDLIVQLIRKHIQYTLLWRRIQCICAVVAIIAIAYYIPFVNANLTAIGRIALIKLLPIWNWRELTDERCLFGPLFTKTIYTTDEAATQNQNGSPHHLYKDDCVLCEHNRMN